MRIRLHFNKFGAPNGRPWTLHTSGACHHASHVVINVPVTTEEKPNRKTNPRYFIRAEGIIRFEGTVAYVEAMA